MRLSLAAVCAAIAALSIPDPVVRADWGYAGVSTTIYNNNTTAKSSSLEFQGKAGGGSSTDSGIVPFRLVTSSLATSPDTDSFTDVKFDVGITMTDDKAGASASAGAVAAGVVHFTGLFNASGVSKSSLLPGATVWTSPTQADVVLGSADTGWRRYTVSLPAGADLAPGQPGGDPGSFPALIHVGAADGPDGSGGGSTGGGDSNGGGGGDPVPVSNAPEPTSLVLAALTLPALLRARRKAG